MNGIEEKKFLSLVEPIKEKLYRIAFSYMKNEFDALEMVQECIFRGYKNFHKLKELRFFSTWMIRILINLCIDELKRRKRIVPLEEHILGCKDDKPKDFDLMLAMDTLHEDYKTVILLKYFEDMKISEIAKILDKPESTVKTWLRRGCKQLEKILKEGE